MNHYPTYDPDDSRAPNKPNPFPGHVSVPWNSETVDVCGQQYALRQVFDRSLRQWRIYAFNEDGELASQFHPSKPRAEIVSELLRNDKETQWYRKLCSTTVYRDRTPLHDGTPFGTLDVFVYTQHPAEWGEERLRRLRDEVIERYNELISVLTEQEEDTGPVAFSEKFQITGFESTQIERDELTNPPERPHYHIEFRDQDARRIDGVEGEIWRGAL